MLKRLTATTSTSINRDLRRLDSSFMSNPLSYPQRAHNAYSTTSHRGGGGGGGGGRRGGRGRDGRDDSTRGRGGHASNPSSDVLEPSPWSTGVYKPWRPRPRAATRDDYGDGSRSSPSPPRRPLDHRPSSSSASLSSPSSPTRRKKLHQRSTPIPTPSLAYLEAAATVTRTTTASDTREPIVLILDLNHTLLCRSQRNYNGSKVPLVRPYLSTFLEYVFLACDPREHGHDRGARRRPHYMPVVFSSARYRNVLTLLAALNLVPLDRLPPPPPPPSTSSSWHGSRYRRPTRGDLDDVATTTTYECDESRGDVLRLVWTRENMGLNPRDFGGDVETTKDLESIWRALGFGQEEERDDEGAAVGRRRSVVDELEIEKKRNLIGASRTILLDDEVSKAAQQPFSLLPVKPFLLSPQDFPPLPFQRNRDSPPPPRDEDDVTTTTAPSPPPPPPPPPPMAIELNHPRDHFLWRDKTLLSIVYQLDQLRRIDRARNGNDNVSHSIGHGRALERIRTNVKLDLMIAREKEKTRTTTTRTASSSKTTTSSSSSSKDDERGGGVVSQDMIERELENRGEALCRAIGIEVDPAWDKGWRERVIQRKLDEERT